MPMLIPALAAGGVAAAGAAGGAATIGGVAGMIGITSVTTAAIVNAGVGTALVLGASYAVAKFTAPPVPKPANSTFEFKQPLPPRFFVYGLMKYSGPVLLLELQGVNLHKIIAFGSRELASIEHFYVNSEEVELDEDGALIGHWDWGLHGNFSEVHTHLGLPDQVADARAITEFSDGWTEDHRLRGIAYAYALLDSGDPEDFNRVFGSGQPEFSIVGGVKVYDPRKDSTNGGSGSHRVNDPASWEFSDNQRLCTLDWITWSDGYGKDWERIDWATWVPQINMADENVALKYGGTEKRYRVATRVSLDEPCSRVLHRLLAAGDQQLFTTATGLIGSRGGVWQPPSVSIEAAQILEGQFTHGIPAMDKVNEFQLSAMLPSHDYGEVELESWSKTDDPEFIAGIVRRQPLELLQVPSNGQAQRLAKIMMAKANPRWSGSVRTNFAGLNALGEAAVNLSFPELDVPADSFNGPFLINGKISFLPDKTGMTVSVSAIDPACYDWTAAEEKDAPPRPQDPWNTVAPVASGSLLVGSVLSCTTGTWTRDPTSYAYQWQRDGINISGATASTYTTVTADGGKLLSCVVTATNDFDEDNIGIGRAVSNALAISAPVAPVNTVPPAISGTATVGQTLTASSGTWTGVPTPTYAYQWKRGGTAISGATASTYVVQPTDVAALITVTVTATNIAGSASATSASVGPIPEVGGALLLTGETNGMATDFTYSADTLRTAIKTAGVVVNSGVDAFFTNTGTSPKLLYDAAGALGWSAHNMFVNSATPATQSVTVVVGQAYTVSVVGSGTLTGSAGAAGVASAGSPLTFTATTATATFTLAGSLASIQMNRGTVATAYLATTAAVRCGCAIDYDPATHAPLGLLVEPGATNVLLSNTTLSTQSVTVTAVAYTLSFFGTGTVTLSGVSTAGPLVGTGANNRVTLTFTPTAGSLTLTVTGTVSNAQLETGSFASSIIRTFAGTATRVADTVSFLLSSIPAIGSDYSFYCRLSTTLIGTSRHACAIGDGTAAEFVGLFSGAAQVTLQVVDNSVTQASLSAGTYVANVFTSAAARIKANDFAYAVDGSAVQTDTVGTLPTVTLVKFGSNTVAAQAVFHIQKLVIVMPGWNNATVQTKSAT